MNMKIAFAIKYFFFDSILEEGSCSIIKIVDTEEKAKSFCESVGTHFGMENEYNLHSDLEYVNLYGEKDFINVDLFDKSITQELQYEKIVIG